MAFACRYGHQTYEQATSMPFSILILLNERWSVMAANEIAATSAQRTMTGG